MKKYQVFISSPSEEFGSAREKVLRTIMEQDCYFPIAMEYFLAYSNTIDMLYRYLQESDIYVLLIGERPGSQIGLEGDAQLRNIIGQDPAVAHALAYYLQTYNIQSSELTYTEVEYIISSALNLPPLVFVKDNLKNDMATAQADPLVRRLFLAARPYSSVYFWDSEAFLSSKIVESLNLHTREHPDMTGWIRETDSKIYRSTAAVGISNVLLNGAIPRDLLREKLAQATELKLLYTTGESFVKSNNQLLADFVARGGSIKLLCVPPHSPALKDVELIERRAIGDRSSIHQEYKNVLHELVNIYVLACRASNCPGRIQVASCRTLFRSSILICENGATQDKWGWFTITLPPLKSRNTVSLEITHSDQDQAHMNDLVISSLQHFNAIWAIAEENKEVMTVTDSVPSIPETSVSLSFGRQAIWAYWQDRQSKAEYTMKRRRGNRQVLIEVAAQHPLLDGCTPDVEFRQRLELAVRLYHENVEKGFQVEIYVPGSLHLDLDGIPDLCSLSEAGVQYLMQQGIPAECLHGDELNCAYDQKRTFSGVYNSGDECFIAAQYFFQKDRQFRDLLCVCAPNQLMRKTLFYINLGIVPLVYTVPAQKMFHNFVYELLRTVPYVLTQDHDYQAPDSQEAIRTRKQRMPGFQAPK